MRGIIGVTFLAERHFRSDDGVHSPVAGLSSELHRARQSIVIG